MADAETERAIDRQRGALVRRRQGFQIENVLLQLLQQGLRFVVFKQIDLILEGAAITVRVVVVVEQADKVPALFAPGGQQRIDAIFRQGGQVAFAVVQLAAQQLFVFDNIRPVMLAGVLYQHQDLAVLTQRRQRFQGLLRQGADAEDDQAAGQARRWRALLLLLSECRDKIPMDSTAAKPLFAVIHVRQQGAPQMRLPQLAAGKLIKSVAILGLAQTVVAVFPVRQPVRPIDLIGIEQIRQPLGQLMAFATVHIVGEKMPQWAEMVVIEKRWQ